MKILYITNRVSDAAGLERVLAVKTNYLIDHLGYEVNIITLNQRDRALFYNFNSRIIFHDIVAGKKWIRYAFDYILGLRKLAKEINPDIIIVCDDGIKGMLSSYFIGGKYAMIYERHVSTNIAIKRVKFNSLQQIKYRISLWLMHIGGRKFNKFVVLSDANLREWNLDNLVVISNPLPFNINKVSDLKHRRVIAIGRQSYQKGYDMLLKSWAKIIEKHPGWRLDIFGKQDPELHLEEIAKGLSIDSSVTFYNPVKDIESEYLKSSILVLSSRFEGFGMVLIEAMSYGLPCVSFDCPHGPGDIIQHEKNGILVKNGDINEFSYQVTRLINNIQHRQIIGLNDTDIAKDFTLDCIMLQWDELFKELLTSKL